MSQGDLTLSETLLRLLLGALLGLLHGVLLGGLVVSCAADGGGPVAGGLWWFLQGPQGHVTPVLQPAGKRQGGKAEGRGHSVPGKLRQHRAEISQDMGHRRSEGLRQQETGWES